MYLSLAALTPTHGTGQAGSLVLVLLQGAPNPMDPPLDKYKKGMVTHSALLKEEWPKEQKHQGFYY